MLDLHINDLPHSLRSHKQWVLWRLEDRDGKLAKVPYQTNGYRASTTSEKDWSNFLEVSECFKSGGYSGIGFVFTDSDSYVGVDLDKCVDNGRIEPWAVEVLEKLNTYAEISPSGTGIKLICKGELASNRGRKVKLSNGAAVEVYTQGRYFTLTGHVCSAADDVQECQDGLDWLCDKYLPDVAPTKPAQQVNECSSFEKYQRALGYMRAYPSAVSGQDGHGKTFHLACVVLNGFDLSYTEAMSILQEYNQRCDPPWKQKELEHKLDSAAEKGQYEARGYKLINQDEYESSVIEIPKEDYSRYSPNIDDLVSSLVSQKSSAFPEKLLNVPGFVNEMADWIDSQNTRYNRTLSVWAAISLASLMLGRKIRDRTRTRTNLYLVIVAPSGGGKQAPQSCIKKVLHACGQDIMFGGKVASDSALANDLQDSPSKLYIWDEFGHFLEKTKSKTGGVHLHAVQEVLLELWGETSTIWKHKSLANKDFNRSVNQPCCSFVGFSTAETFWRGLEESHLTDGFAARLILIDSGLRGKEFDAEETEPPESVLEWVKYWANFTPGGNLANENPVPRVITETKEAQAIFKGLGERQNNVFEESEQATWSRAVEKAKKLALVYACSADVENAHIDREAAQWAVDVVSHCTESFIHKCKDEVIDDSQFQRRWKKVLNIIRQATSQNKLCSRTQLNRKCKLRKVELDDVITLLRDSNLIEEREPNNKKKGPSTTYYVAK